MTSPFDFGDLPPPIARVLRFALERRMAIDLGQDAIAEQQLVQLDDACIEFKEWSRDQAELVALKMAFEEQRERTDGEVQVRRSDRAKRIEKGGLTLVQPKD